MADKYYQHLNMADKKKVRDIIAKIIALKKEQIELFEKNIIKAYKDDIEMAIGVQHNKYPLRYLMDNCQKGSNHVKKFVTLVGDNQ